MPNESKNESKKPDLKTPLLSEEITKNYTCCERALCCCFNIPCSCNSIDWRFRYAIANDKFTHQQPLLGYRGTSQAPNEIFTAGFSAYSLKRSDSLTLTLCGLNVGFWAMGALGVTVAKGALGTFLCACGFTCGACCCMFSAVPLGDKHGCCPTNLLGQQLYKAPYVSNWGALSLTLNWDNAFSYATQSSRDESWRYIVYMNSCIRYDLFSEHVIEKEIDYDPTRDEESSIFNAKEILPKNLRNQTVAPQYVIAGAKYQRDSTKPQEFIFDTQCVFWKKIEPRLKKTSVAFAEQKNEMPSLTTTFSELNLLLIKELNIQNQPELQYLASAPQP